MTGTIKNAALKKSLGAGLIVAATLCAAAPLRAQEVLFSGGDVRANPLLPESKGVKVGEGRLHPFFELDAHSIYNAPRFSSGLYDAAAERFPSLTPPQVDPLASRRNDFYFVGRPGVDYKLPSPHLEIGATAYVERQQYIDNDQFSSWQGGIGGNLHFNKDGPLQLRASERLTRIAAPGNQTFAQRFDHWTNSTGVGVDVVPGGGALKLSADMSFYFDWYDKDSQVPPEYLNNERYTPTLRASWSFLPKTQVFVETTTTFTNFRETQGLFANRDSWIYSAYAGLNGVITPKISALLRVGYTGITADTLSALDPSKNTVGTQLEFTWNATATTKLRLGGVRSLEPIPIFVYATMWKAYTRIDQAIASRLNLSLGAEYYNFSYQRGAQATGGDADDGGDRRHDDAIQASIAIAYYVTEFITISLVDRVDYRHTNYVYDQVVQGVLFDDTNAGFITNDLFLRFGFRY